MGGRSVICDCVRKWRDKSIDVATAVVVNGVTRENQLSIAAMAFTLFAHAYGTNTNIHCDKPVIASIGVVAIVVQSPPPTPPRYSHVVTSNSHDLRRRPRPSVERCVDDCRLGTAAAAAASGRQRSHSSSAMTTTIFISARMCIFRNMCPFVRVCVCFSVSPLLAIISERFDASLTR